MKSIYEKVLCNYVTETDQCYPNLREVARIVEHSWNQISKETLMKCFVRTGVKDSDTLRCVTTKSPKQGEITWAAVEYLLAYQKIPELVESVWNGKTQMPREVDEVDAQVILAAPPSISASPKTDYVVQRKAIDSESDSDASSGSLPSDESSGDDSSDSEDDEQPAKKSKGKAKKAPAATPANKVVESPAKKTKQEKLSPRYGIINDGQTCHLNSILQCLRSCSGLFETICNPLLNAAPPTTNSEKIFDALRSTMMGLVSATSNVSAADMRKAMEIDAHTQEDGAETAIKILMALPPSVQDLVTIPMLQTLKCVKCDHIASVGIAEHMLALPFVFDKKTNTVSLQEMLDTYQLMTLAERKCEHAPCTGQYAEKTDAILNEDLPKYLILHLKRFTTVGNQPFKICDVVQGIQNIRIHQTQYTLKSAAAHRANQPAHYKAYVKNGTRHVTVHYTVFDDTGVSEKSGDFDGKVEKEWTPYVLFYEKVVLQPVED